MQSKEVYGVAGGRHWKKVNVSQMVYVGFAVEEIAANWLWNKLQKTVIGLSNDLYLHRKMFS